MYTLRWHRVSVLMASGGSLYTVMDKSSRNLARRWAATPTNDFVAATLLQRNTTTQSLQYQRLVERVAYLILKKEKSSRCGNNPRMLQKSSVA